ncbi:MULTISPECIES: PilN domain-containing protein [Salinicola]|jgi:type IV pilus assembly protein PilN|uniref:PilN domain-containing protein n=1 Tax=Salinicola TaxID=404432 RepID=UPI0026EC6864|nr:PilN domain-containing protein [Salinicola salarius]MEC8919028.1 PilN domain-containing protein [Pseudomonadota bacterium]
MTIEINLLPWREQRRLRKTRRFKQGLLLMLLLGLLVGWGIAQYEKSMVRAGQARLALIQRETDALTRDIQEMRNFRQLRERMLKQIDLIGELQSSRPLTIRVLDQLTATLVDGVHYTELNRRGSRLELSGVATSNRQVSDQMRALDNSSAFDIPLLSDVQSAEGPAAAKRFHMSVDEHPVDEAKPGAGS